MCLIFVKKIIDMTNWEEIISAYQASGQSKIGFSKANGIKEHNLRYHLKKSKSGSERGFVQIAVPSINKDVSNDTSSACTEYEIQYPNGVRIYIQGQADVKLLIQLIGV